MKFKSQYHTDFDLILLSKDERKKAEKRYINYGEIPDSSGSLFLDTGTYDPYERRVELLSKDLTMIPAVFTWLDGAGDLDLDEGGIYKVRVMEVATVTESFTLGWTRIIVTFEFQPFLFLESHDMILTSGQKIFNEGLESDPYFKISGTGEVTVFVNGVEAFTVFVDQFVEIEYPFARKGVLNKGRDLTAFPKIPSGEVIVTWTGSVYEMLFNGRWRTL